MNLRELTLRRIAARSAFHDTVASVLPEVYRSLPRGAAIDEIDAAVDRHPLVIAAREVSRQAQEALDEAIRASTPTEVQGAADDGIRAAARAIRPAYDPAHPPVEDPADED